MIRWLLIACLYGAPTLSLADTLMAARTIPAQTILVASDLAVAGTAQPGALRDPAKAIGQETRTILYQGRPIRSVDIGPAAVVERNDLVALTFTSPHLEIVTEGRALERGAAGDRVRVMNLASRTTITATITGPGHVRVVP
ncbi:MAG: flagellar basal body P-ring formation chaperone FlgA [Pseudomonadota bacterium]